MHKKFNSADSILELFINHTERLKWHIRRIYRTRNLIVHSGKFPEKISILVENLHTYLDRTFEIILSTFSQSAVELSIEEITLENRMSLDEHMDYLKNNKKSKCTKENFKELLYGK